MLLVETRVAPSPIHGLGLFAVVAIPRGTPIWRFQPGFDRDFAPSEAAALPQITQAHLRWFSYVRPEDQHFVLSGDHACFMNHSAAPNTGVPRETHPPVTTIALRDIAPGEELTCDYFTFDTDAPVKLGQAGAGRS
jgi:uncharacterized protein